MRLRSSLFICWLLMIELSLTEVGSATSQEGAKIPLSEEQILGLVTSSKLGEINVNRVVELITERGLSFRSDRYFPFGTWKLARRTQP